MAAAVTKFGIQTYDYPPEQLLALAKAADRLGFEGLWMGEHYVNPSSFTSTHPGDVEKPEVTEDDILGPHVTLYDPWFFLGAVAGASLFGVASIACAYWLTGQLAKRAASVREMS